MLDRPHLPSCHFHPCTLRVCLSAGRAQGHEEDADQERPWIVVDGVRIDPHTMSVCNDAGAPIAVSRMGIRELRAELAARRAPVSGNKKDLTKRLQVRAWCSVARLLFTVHVCMGCCQARKEWGGSNSQCV